jgi:hypothetical protein
MKIVIIINIKDYKCEFMSEKIKRERERNTLHGIFWIFGTTLTSCLKRRM